MKLYITKIISLAFIISLSSCCIKKNNGPIAYRTVMEGVEQEVFDSTNTDENKYNLDNVIFKIGNSLTYRYSMVKNGVSYVDTSYEKSWELIEKSKAIDFDPFVEMSVLNGNPMQKWVRDYRQTSFKYKFDSPYASMTGIIENEKNLWFHPPRAGIFRILELSPFPFVKYPLEIGKEFGWELIIGSHYGDERYIVWEGNILNKMTYKVLKEINLNTVFGELNCFQIEGVATSELGVGKADFYFNEKYGFVKMVFNCIDGTLITLKLEEFNNKSK